MRAILLLAFTSLSVNAHASESAQRDCRFISSLKSMVRSMLR